MRFRNQNQIVLLLDDTVRASAGAYYCNATCPIATAIKQRFPNVDVWVGIVYATINNVVYRILGDVGRYKIIDEIFQEKEYDISVVLERVERG